MEEMDEMELFPDPVEVVIPLSCALELELELEPACTCWYDKARKCWREGRFVEMIVFHFSNSAE